MTSKLNKCQICFCYGRVDDKNFYDDSYILGSDIACHYCTLERVCKYCDEGGNDNRRCFRYLSNGTQFKCVLYCTMRSESETRKRDLLLYSKII